VSLRVGVIGLGAMGRNHARVYWELPDADLVGVSDINLEAVEGIAKKFNTEGYSDFRTMLDRTKPEAVSLAVPTSLHKEVALEAIQRSIHILIEKPIAFSLEEAIEIAQAAQQYNVQLMIGHIERFNPAILELKQHIQAGDLGEVLQLDARRQGPFPSRINDVGVVIDLAVHDIDIMRFVTGQEVQRVSAEIQYHIHSGKEDLLSAVMRFSKGAVGTLNTNWLTPTKIREISVLGTNGLFVVNYLTQDLRFFKNSAISAEWETLNILRGVTEGEMTKFVFPRKEPLRAEVEAFLSAVRGEIPVPVNAKDGFAALKVAQALIQAGQRYSIITI